MDYTLATVYVPIVASAFLVGFTIAVVLVFFGGRR